MTTKKKKSGTVQSVAFKKKQWDKQDAIAWLENEGYSTSNFDDGKEFYHFRQVDPKQFDRIRIKRLKGGIELNLGFTGKETKKKDPKPRTKAKKTVKASAKRIRRTGEDVLDSKLTIRLSKGQRTKLKKQAKKYGGVSEMIRKVFKL